MPQYVNPKLRVKILKAETIEARPIKEGNMFFDQQNGELYFDLESQRVVIGRPKWSKISLDSNLPGGGDDPSDEGGLNVTSETFMIGGVSHTASVKTSFLNSVSTTEYVFDEAIVPSTNNCVIITSDINIPQDNMSGYNVVVTDNTGITAELEGFALTTNGFYTATSVMLNNSNNKLTVGKERSLKSIKFIIPSETLLKVTISDIAIHIAATP